MYYSPLTYHEPLYRPPSEARSVIFQVTLGCSWNRCTFCSMYNSKQFRIRKERELFAEIGAMSRTFPRARRFFLADGDALVLANSKLLPILEAIKRSFPQVSRVSAYASPRNLNAKSTEELTALRKAGLTLIYLGIESGDDEVLHRVEKGETAESTVRGLLKARDSGMRTSVMIINGLGGRRYSERHAVASARVVTRVEPDYLSTLVLTIPRLKTEFYRGFDNCFEELTMKGLLEEQRQFLEHTALQHSLFRSSHASNFLVLKGVLGGDKERLLSQIDQVLEHADQEYLTMTLHHTDHL